jgi:hypothetical protein
MTDAEQLEELKTARHSLLTGKRVTEVRYEGETLTFSQVDLAELDRMISKLEAATATTATRRRPLRPIF